MVMYEMQAFFRMSNILGQSMKCLNYFNFVYTSLRIVYNVSNILGQSIKCLNYFNFVYSTILRIVYIIHRHFIE